MRDRVDHCALHSRCRPDRAALADALRAEVVERRRSFGVHRLKARQLGRRRDGVVGEVGGQRVAVLVVDHLFEQRLGNALGQPTVDGVHPQAVLHRLAASDANLPSRLGGVSRLLLEDGTSLLLLEDGSKLLLES